VIGPLGLCGLFGSVPGWSDPSPAHTTRLAKSNGQMAFRASCDRPV